MFFEPIVLCMSIYLSFIYSLLYLLFFAFPIAFEEVRGWNEGLTGTAFIAVMVSEMMIPVHLLYSRCSMFKARHRFGLCCIAIPGGLVQACYRQEGRDSRSQIVPDDARFDVRSPRVMLESWTHLSPKHSPDCAIHLCLYRKLRMGTLNRSLRRRLPVRPSHAAGICLRQFVHCRFVRTLKSAWLDAECCSCFCSSDTLLMQLGTYLNSRGFSHD